MEDEVDKAEQRKIFLSSLWEIFVWLISGFGTIEPIKEHPVITLILIVGLLYLIRKIIKTM